MEEQQTEMRVVVYDNPDSIEIGTPAKGGVMKVYGSADDPEGFRKKIDAMVEVRKYAQEKTGVTG